MAYKERQTTKHQKYALRPTKYNKVALSVYKMNKIADNHHLTQLLTNLPDKMIETGFPFHKPLDHDSVTFDDDDDDDVDDDDDDGSKTKT